MAMKSMGILALFLSMTILLVPSVVFPCGPVFPTAIFSLTGRPDAPLQNFLRGDLGVLQPNFRSYYLVPAYRYLIGIGLNPEEQQALLGETRDSGNNDLHQETKQQEDSIQNWLDARSMSRNPGTPPEIGWHSRGTSAINRTEQKNGNYVNYLNCTDDAFKTATTTLAERVSVFGAQSPEVLNWIAAQDMVFSNCSRGRSIPEPLPAGSNPILKADRAYQIAAANFYSGDFDEAEKLFLEISKDNMSPWKTIAPYLAARCQVRNATIKGGFQKVEMISMSRAEVSLHAILQNSSLSRYHKAAEDLLRYVEMRLRPAERLHKLALQLTKKNAGPQLLQYLQEFRYQLMNTDLQAQNAARGLDDLTDWMLTFQNQISDPLGHAIERWEKTKSQAWLIAAISKISAGHPKQQLLQSEADKLLPTAPGYQTAIYHSIRLLVDSGNKDIAKKKLHLLLANPNNHSLSAKNLLLGLRLQLSNSLDDFLQHSQRVAVAVGYGYDEDEIYMDEQLKPEYGYQKMLDNDSVAIMNGYMPEDMLIEIASKPILDQKIRKAIALSAWTRAVLLEKLEAAKQSGAVLSSIAPDMQAQLEGYATTRTQEERKFVGSYIILKNPGLKPYIVSGIGRTTALDKIDNFRDNWWCQLGSERNPLRRKFDFKNKLGKIAKYPNLITREQKEKKNYPEFITKEQMQVTQKEIEALQKLDTTPNHLAEAVLPWAESHPEDSRVPEALYLLVKATRYGCTDNETSTYSKKAFKLLHKQYPRTKWAKETPYYY